MECFTEARLTDLAAKCEFPSVSLFMPTKSWQTLQAVAEDKTRFRRPNNSLSRAEFDLRLPKK
jgi:hypothetical protein